MAPVPGISRAAAIAIVRAHDERTSLEVDLGTPHRCASLRYTPEHGWSIVEMTASPERVDEALREASAAGRSFVAEHVVLLQTPGDAIIPTTSRTRFLAALAILPWTYFGPGDRPERTSYFAHVRRLLATLG